MDLTSWAGQRVGNSLPSPALIRSCKEAMGVGVVNVWKCPGAKLMRLVSNHLPCHLLPHSHCSGGKAREKELVQTGVSPPRCY